MAWLRVVTLVLLVSAAMGGPKPRTNPIGGSLVTIPEVPTTSKTIYNTTTTATTAATTTTSNTSNTTSITTTTTKTAATTATNETSTASATTNTTTTASAPTNTTTTATRTTSATVTPSAPTNTTTTATTTRNATVTPSAPTNTTTTATTTTSATVTPSATTNTTTTATTTTNVTPTPSTTTNTTTTTTATTTTNTDATTTTTATAATPTTTVTAMDSTTAENLTTSTSTSTATSTAATASASTTTVPPPTNSSIGCSCTHNKIWLDVVLVLDSSSAMTFNGLQSLNFFLLAAFQKMTIGQQLDQVSRIGVVTYSDSATLESPLTTFTSTDDIVDNMNPSYQGKDGSNIEDGIRKAIVEFEKNGRANTKKVIVIAASHFEPGQWTDPTQAAAVFRGNGGTVITLEYVQSHGTAVPILEQLASDCSQLSNRDEQLRVDNFLAKFCQANCFCASNWKPYSVDQKCKTPSGGCYYPVFIPTSQKLSKRYCKILDGATLPVVEDAKKAGFLTSLLKNQHDAQWIGLQNNDGYQWVDGSELGPYQPFLNQTGTGKCFAQKRDGTDVNWLAEDCFDDYVYTCQKSPCSSDMYCQ